MERDFWSMTPAEIGRYFDAQRRRVEHDRKERALFDWLQAQTLYGLIAHLMDKRNAAPTFTEIYAEITETEQDREEREKREQAEYIERFKAWASAHNDRLERGNE